MGVSGSPFLPRASEAAIPMRRPHHHLHHGFLRFGGQHAFVPVARRAHKQSGHGSAECSFLIGRCCMKTGLLCQIRNSEGLLREVIDARLTRKFRLQ
jgi:hypothetical protein